ncbi:methyltransferase-related protein [Tasmannia lanceolata]|uniref:methyltransferase-related protein n=1 Tax=Tasmannia lanceolata TaxID=3420 RepID=UPI0040630700
MCPLRFILIFFSATLAGYFAWKSLRSDGEDESSGDLTVEKKSTDGNEEFGFRKVMERGFWVLVDMASGRYLWRNLREVKESEKGKGY